MAHHLKLRYIPELSFQWDDSIEQGAHLQELIDKVSHPDTPEAGRS
jgi:ribosome-binding factor A